MSDKTKTTEQHDLFVIAFIQEAYSDIREGSRRIGQHVRFLEAVTVAFAGLLVVLTTSGPPPHLMTPAIAVVGLSLGMAGLVVIARLCAIKIQGAKRLAHAYRCCDYFVEQGGHLSDYFSGTALFRGPEDPDAERPFDDRFALSLGLLVLFVSGFFTAAIWAPLLSFMALSECYDWFECARTHGWNLALGGAAFGALWILLTKYVTQQKVKAQRAFNERRFCGRTVTETQPLGHGGESENKEGSAT